MPLRHVDEPISKIAVHSRWACAGSLFLAGRVVGADTAAYGSLRVMGTAFVTGQAAGIAAALRASSASVSACNVRKNLSSQNAII